MNDPALKETPDFDAQDTTMATVKKISRSVNYLPPIKTLTEWFNYAFKSSELDEVHRFPSLSGGGGGGGGGPGGEQRDRGGDSRAQQRTEDIFALPCLQMDLKTTHVQVSASTQYFTAFMMKTKI